MLCAGKTAGCEIVALLTYVSMLSYLRYDYIIERFTILIIFSLHCFLTTTAKGYLHFFMHITFTSFIMYSYVIISCVGTRNETKIPWTSKCNLTFNAFCPKHIFLVPVFRQPFVDQQRIKHGTYFVYF